MSMLSETKKRSRELVPISSAGTARLNMATAHSVSARFGCSTTHCIAKTSRPWNKKYSQKNRGCTRAESPLQSKKLYSATSSRKMRVDERGSVGFMRRPLCNCVMGGTYLKSAGGGESATTYTPLLFVFRRRPPRDRPYCTVLPRSVPVTAIATQSSRNQRNGSFVRNLFLMGQRLLPR